MDIKSFVEKLGLCIYGIETVLSHFGDINVVGEYLHASLHLGHDLLVFIL